MKDKLLLAARDNLLKIPILYKLFTFCLGKFGTSRSDAYAKYLPYTLGKKVLDLGCGPGSSAKYFQQCDYLGIDVSEAYLKHARDTYPNHEFINIEFTSLIAESSFDVILAYGLFHHLNNDLSADFFGHAYKVLNTGGVLICFDGCIHDQQSKFDRKLVLADRGKFIRPIDELKEFAEESGFRVYSKIDKNLLALEYSLGILACHK